MNATKHGIFAQATVLKSESREEYEALLCSLQDHYQPEGGLEHVLVEKIASLIWRHRRVLLAERGDLETRAISRELTPPGGLPNIIAEIARRTVPLRTGLIEEIADPIILHRCLLLLNVLRSGIEDHGFQIERDQKILTEIYGRPDEYRISKTLYDTYTGWANKSNVSRKRRDNKAVIENVLRAIDGEIGRLEQLRGTRAVLETEKIRFEKLRRNIPEGEQFLRYEVSLDRALDRTMNQLERVQRMRKGQFLPPPINVQLS